MYAAFLSPLDYQLVSLAIAARLVLDYVESGQYIDPEKSLLPELQRTARRIAEVVPLFRVKDTEPVALEAREAAQVDSAELDECAIRLGDLRTALLHLGPGSLKPSRP